jgi:hypothetical protein
MPGYSKTPLALKLGLVEGRTLVLLGAPEGFEMLLEPLPVNTRVTRTARSPLRLAIVFATLHEDLKRKLPIVVEKLHADGMLWVAWPKKGSKTATDLRENAVRATGLLAGVVDNKVCAIDETWSGLRFQFRLQDRPRRRERAAS